MFLLRREQDRLAEVAPLLGALAGAQPQDSLWRPGLAASGSRMDNSLLDEAYAICTEKDLVSLGSRIEALTAAKH